MRSKTVCIFLLGLMIGLGNEAPGQSLHVTESAPLQPGGHTGSALTAKEADALVEYHNKARKEVGVAPVTWSPKVAKFAQEWADEVARTGKLLHRPREGAWQQEYGENMAWGLGDAYGILTGAEDWYNEIKFYKPGTSIPEDFGRFEAAHYTQMVWKDTIEIGAGKAIVRKGEKQGWMVIVCNYNPPGNITGQKPY